MPLLDASALDQDLEQLTALFRLLSDKTRLNILLALAMGERNVTSLCKGLRLPQPTVSHHLGLLRVNNMIGSRRLGKQVFYALHGAVTRIEGNALEISAANFCLRITRGSTTPRSVQTHP
ncbi:MAG TPA: metalloregulator ArsR/SmtB family transcription factor [Tepidisphaeraceae bacterium]|nr:metalloregulator ArsR/SmtB family transcription factor [Tepidisphaeraceae bacterium]